MTPFGRHRLSHGYGGFRTSTHAEVNLPIGDFGPISHHGETEFPLNFTTMKQGIQIMADKYPEHFANVINENDDAETGDVFLQCCLFGEVVFG